jgi:lysophospholipase L1-like esterase
MVPYRGEWESFAAVLEQQDEKREFVRSLCNELGIPSLDGREAFDEAIAAEGPEPFFINEPVWDFHFSGRGHQLYADWLAQVLPISHHP